MELKTLLTLEEIRDNLLHNLKISEKLEDKRNGYIDGVLDMYNDAKRLKEEVKCQ